MINQLRQQKAEALDYYVKTKDKNVRAYMRKLDGLIRKELDNGNNSDKTKIHSTTRGFTKTSTIG